MSVAQRLRCVSSLFAACQTVRSLLPTVVAQVLARVFVVLAVRLQSACYSCRTHARAHSFRTASPTRLRQRPTNLRLSTSCRTRHRAQPREARVAGGSGTAANPDQQCRSPWMPGHGRGASGSTALAEPPGRRLLLAPEGACPRRSATCTPRTGGTLCEERAGSGASTATRGLGGPTRACCG